MNTIIIHLLLVNIFREDNIYDTVLLATSENKVSLEHLRDGYRRAVRAGYEDTIKFFKDNNAIILNSNLEFDYKRYNWRSLQCTHQSIFIKSACVHRIGG